MRSASLATIGYAPNTPPSDPKALPGFLEVELNRIAAVVTLLAAGHLDTIHAAPTKPRAGDIRLADGSDWDPGSGAGVYTFYTAAGDPGPDWHKLG